MIYVKPWPNELASFLPFGHPAQIDTSWSQIICPYKNELTNDMREIYGLLRLASRLANPFGHPSQVRTQVLVLQTCVDLRQLASPFGQGFRFTALHIWSYLGLALLPNVESKFCQYTKHRLQGLMQTPKRSQDRSHDSVCSSALGLTKLVVFEDNKNEAVFLVHKFRDHVRTFRLERSPSPSRLPILYSSLMRMRNFEVPPKNSVAWLDYRPWCNARLAT